MIALVSSWITSLLKTYYLLRRNVSRRFVIYAAQMTVYNNAQIIYENYLFILFVFILKIDLNLIFKKRETEGHDCLKGLLENSTNNIDNGLYM